MPNIKKMLTPNTNEIDDITGNLVDNTIYSDINTLYPE
jgi:hypothetical protein